MLPNGNWIGRGRFITREHVLGEPIECLFKVSSEDPGIIIEGFQEQEGSAPRREFSIVISADDSGTYELDVHFGDWSLAGTAKLESQPCLGLLWSEDGRLHATFALFDLANGHGLRGIIHAAGTVISWELALQEHHRVMGGDNVVTLSARRRR
ncbi:MAG: hypothetical protein O7G84_13265 [Gammaproteobacteria bacterium]|jgi:hypothetical protein|nr:hypothetical protein [Gammaproteobacteria bacterium]